MSPLKHAGAELKPASDAPLPDAGSPDALARSAPGEDAPSVIEVRGLVSRFGEHIVHDGLDLTMRKGEVLGLVGGSGAGKSVLLNTIIGLKTPDGGAVKVFGVDLGQANSREIDDVEARWGVLFQQGALFSALSVLENVSAPVREHTGLSRHLAEELATLKIVMTGLGAEVAHLRPAELSGGMRKRVGLARAIVLDPELLFLDEPTAGLDPIAAEGFDTLIRKLSDALGLSVLMVTHDLDSLYAITDRVAVIADKKVVATAPVHELERSDHPWIKEYFQGPRGRAAQGAETKTTGARRAEANAAEQKGRG